MSGPDKPFFDEAKFRRALPFEVVPTAIPGVYDVPRPLLASTRARRPPRNAAAPAFSGVDQSPIETPSPARSGKGQPLVVIRLLTKASDRHRT